jgi:hypothetical protein
MTPEINGPFPFENQSPVLRDKGFQRHEAWAARHPHQDLRNVIQDRFHGVKKAGLFNPYSLVADKELVEFRI